MTLVLANWLAVMAALGQDPALAPFARGGAVFVWSLDGRVLLAANPAAERLIALHHAARNHGSQDRNAYGESCRERLRLLGQGLAPATGVRLERLKLGVGPDLVIATCACRRVRLSTGEEGIVVIARGLDDLSVFDAAEEQADVQRQPSAQDDLEAAARAGAVHEVPDEAVAPFAAEPVQNPATQPPTAGGPGRYSLSGFSSGMTLRGSGLQPRFSAQSGYVPKAPVVAAFPSGPGAEAVTVADEQVPGLVGAVSNAPSHEGIDPQDAVPAEAPVPGPMAAQVSGPGPSAQPALSLRQLRRVLWESDAEDRVKALSPDLVAMLDLPSPHDLLGHRWQDLINLRIKDPGDGFISSIAARKTFSNQRLLFRVGETGRAFMLDMSGSPVFDAGHSFAGYRGFGLPRFSEEVQPAADMDDRPEVPGAGHAEGVATPAPGHVEALVTEPVTQHKEMVAEPVAPLIGAIDHGLEAAGPAILDVPVPAKSPILATEPPTRAEPAAKAELSKVERHAFRQIAKALGADVEADDVPAEAVLPAAAMATDLATQLPDGALRPDDDGEASRGPDTSPSGDVFPDALEKAADPGTTASGAQEPVQIADEPDEDSESLADLAMIDGTPAADPHKAPKAGASRVEQAPVPAVAAATSGPTPAPLPGTSVVVPLHPNAPQPARPDVAEVARHGAPPALVATNSDGFAELLDKLPIGVMVNRGGEAIYANRTFLDLLGYHSLQQIEQMGGMDRLFRGPAPHEGGGAVNLMAQDGDIETVEARLSSINWRGKAATLMAFRRAVDSDAPAKLQAAELDIAKRDTRLNELAAILDTATDGVVTVDDQGRILSLNSTAEALFGYDQREVTGEPISILFAPESHNLAMDYLEGLKGGGVASVLNDGREVLGRVRQGGQVPLFMTMGRIADGAERKFCAVLRDITAWKLAERELTEARKAAENASAQKSDVLAKISHEIRTPLNAIIGFSEVMAEERFGPIGNERYKEYSRDIRESGGYLISLVNDLLDLAKIEAGRLDLEFVSVNLNDIATSAVALLQPEAARNRVVLRSGLSPKLPPVVADDRSLRQIVINLLSNAVKFTDAGGQVIVSTALGDKGEAILRVRDTGIGMTEKELALALEPFRQVSTTKRGGGTGLGLPLTKALVEANRGSFVITSIKAEGTLAEVIFPPQRVLAS